MSIYFAIILLVNQAGLDLPWSVLKLAGEANKSIDQPLIPLAIGSLLTGLMLFALQNYFLVQEARHRRQVEAELQVSEAHHRALIKALPDLIMRLNRDGIYLEFLRVSPNFQVLGSLPSSWIGTHVTDKLPTDLAKKRLDAIQTALETQSMQIYEQNLTVNGVLQMEQVRVVPYSNDEVLVLVQDIGDRKRAEQQLRVSEQRFRQAIEMAPLPIMIHAEDGEVIHVNSTWTQLTGYTHQQIPTTRAWAALAYGAEAADIFQNVISKKYTLEARQEEGIFTITTLGGTQRVWQFSSSPLEQLVDGRRLAISMAIDITESRQIEIALRDSEERYRSIYNQAAVGFATGTIDGRFIDVNPRFCEMLGYSREELLSKFIWEIVHPDDRAESQAISKELLEKDTTHIFCKKRYLRKGGSYFWSSTDISVVRNSLGHPQHTLEAIRDISDRVTFEEQLRYDALHDQLTGLPNRSLLMERLDLALQRTKRYPGTQLAVLFLDLDNFKIVNDSLGHQLGDELLLAVASRLKLAIRETDLAARLGGDEFVVLLEEISGLSEAVMVAERIVGMLRSPVYLTGRELFPSVSIGIVTSTQKHYSRATALLRDADAAMYCAKQSGRGQYKIFDASMHLEAIQRLQIENNLQKALENEQFLIYYQPIVNLQTQKIEAFEALLRWQHPERGLLSPDYFIPIAEEIGMIVAIGEWVLHRACHQLMTWQLNFPQQLFSISINLSAQQLEKPLLSKLEEILAEYSFDKSSLMLEITESMLVKNVETTCSLLARLRRKGIEIVIDDFGTGYSCLRYLYQLPISSLKIDRGFISSAGPELRNRMIAESIISLCQSLGVRAVAEGVETAEQMNWLRQAGCDAGQGFYFAKPMSEDAVSELLNSLK